VPLAAGGGMCGASSVSMGTISSDPLAMGASAGGHIVGSMVGCLYTWCDVGYKSSESEKAKVCHCPSWLLWAYRFESEYSNRRRQLQAKEKRILT
jgi:hypothetical protein